MYFESREEAGKRLAAILAERYRYENCAVVALSDGATLIGEEIAAALHCILTLLLVEDIAVPGEHVSFGGVSQNGNFTYNGTFSAGEVEEYTNEFHNYLEEQKHQAFQRLNRSAGEGGLINYDVLRDHTVILVADGLDQGATEIDVAMDFLKPIRTAKIVVATPVASVQAVDKLHVLADELHVLDVKDNYVGTDHYYSKNDIPSHEQTIEKINKIVLNWR